MCSVFRDLYSCHFRNPLSISQLKINTVFVGRNEFQNFVKYFNLFKTQVKQAGFEQGKLLNVEIPRSQTVAPTATFLKFDYKYACVGLYEFKSNCPT